MQRFGDLSTCQDMRVLDAILGDPESRRSRPSSHYLLPDKQQSSAINDWDMTNSMDTDKARLDSSYKDGLAPAVVRRGYPSPCYDALRSRAEASMVTASQTTGTVAAGEFSWRVSWIPSVRV